MKKLLRTMTAALALAASQMAGAAVVNFDRPGLIEIDNDSGRALYREAGFALTGQAAGFLTIDGLGSAGTSALVLLDGSTISLKTGTNGLFDFSGLAGASLDPQGSATLDILGIFGDSSRRSLMLSLSGLDAFALTPWMGLTELRLTAGGDLVLDDIRVDANAVPEPASIAMLALGFGLLVGLRKARPARSRAR